MTSMVSPKGTNSRTVAIVITTEITMTAFIVVVMIITFQGRKFLSLMINRHVVHFFFLIGVFGQTYARTSHQRHLHHLLKMMEIYH